MYMIMLRLDGTHDGLELETMCGDNVAKTHFLPVAFGGKERL